ncbi:MAG: alpha/beta hydrolase [Clostridia bacterium]|nr:alpha/beta hydrolase [Clostridia bacterium]
MEKIIAAIVAAIIGIITALFGGSGSGSGSTTTTTTNPYVPTTVTTTVPLQEYNSISNYVYGADANRQSYNLYIPKDAKGTVGLILYIHGGFWMMGDKGDFDAQAREAAGRGYVGATVNYRYASLETHLDDIMSDLVSAVSSIKNVAASRGVNVEKMIVCGFSAGSHLAMMYGYTKVGVSAIKPVAVWDMSGPADLSDEMWLDGGDGMMNVFTCLTGGRITQSNFTSNIAQTVLKQDSPIYHISSSSVPTIISHGKKDKTVPYANGEMLYKTLFVNNVRVVAFSYPNSDHGLESDPTVHEQAKATLYNWAKTYM